MQHVKSVFVRYPQSWLSFISPIRLLKKFGYRSLGIKREKSMHIKEYEREELRTEHKARSQASSRMGLRAEHPSSGDSSSLPRMANVRPQASDTRPQLSEIRPPSSEMSPANLQQV